MPTITGATQNSLNSQMNSMHSLLLLRPLFVWVRMRQIMIYRDETAGIYIQCLWKAVSNVNLEFKGSTKQPSFYWKCRKTVLNAYSPLPCPIALNSFTCLASKYRPWTRSQRGHHESKKCETRGMTTIYSAFWIACLRSFFFPKLRSLSRFVTLLFSGYFQVSFSKNPHIEALPQACIKQTPPKLVFLGLRHFFHCICDVRACGFSSRMSHGY